jgi:hypothetical protein
MTVTNSLPHCKKCGLVEYDCHCEATDVPVAGANLARVGLPGFRLSGNTAPCGEH